MRDQRDGNWRIWDSVYLMWGLCTHRVLRFVTYSLQFCPYVVLCVYLLFFEMSQTMLLTCCVCRATYYVHLIVDYVDDIMWHCIA